MELRARIKASSCPSIPSPYSNPLSPTRTSSTLNVQRSASLRDHRVLRRSPTDSVSTPIASSTPASPRSTNTATTTTAPIRRSFVPPVRDEESETQRKAHAKRVRETRRSTQGVTLDEIKSAEQLVKKKNNNNNNEFKLEDATPAAEPPSAIAPVTRRLGSTSGSVPRPLSAPPEAPKPLALALDTHRGSLDTNRLQSDDATAVTLQLRKGKTAEDKEQDKENDVRNAQNPQAVIQRRRRPKRRSTGVVHVDMDDIDPEKQDGESVAGDLKNNHESGSEKSGRASRLGSTNSLADGEADDATENGELIDYKALWESAKVDNERLHDQLKKRNDELKDAKATIDRVTNVTTKHSLSEIEKREKRAMERKLSEMEEELKHLENLKAQNQQLKDENGALIRVISKLSK